MNNMRQIGLVLAVGALAACGHARQQQTAAENSSEPVAPATSAPPAVQNSATSDLDAIATAPVVNQSAPTAAPQSKTQPDSRQTPQTSLAEPAGPIDPKSVEAAGQVVQYYGALVEQKRLSEAAKLWGDPKAAKQFEKTLPPGTHLEIGDLGPMEGAAGSSYTTVPVVFYVKGFRNPGKIVLRRVNDVPGSTEAQRRWHIVEVDMSRKTTD